VTIRNEFEKVVIDSTGWVEFWGEGPRAESYAPYFEREGEILLPTIVLYEVYKKILRARGQSLADRFLSFALRQQSMAFDAELAVAAALMSLEHKLAMADAIVYATASRSGAQLITSDTHFEGLPGVTIL
jgi:predicted nucleic acid-binding protein